MTQTRIDSIVPYAAWHRGVIGSAGIVALVLGLSAATGRAVVAQTPGAGTPPARVVTHDFSFEMPDSLSAGLTTFLLRNEGHEPHHLMLYRLDAGKPLSDVYAALAADGAHPAWMHAVGGPNAVLSGEEFAGTLLLESGRYVAFCHVVSPDRKVHFAKGMLKQIEVTGTRDPGAGLPASDITLTLRDYSFTLSRPPTRGRHVITVRNAGTQPHEAILSRLAPGKSSADFVRWMNTQQGPPPVTPAGGVTDLPAGGSMVITVTFEPGRYSLVCRVRGATDGRPHDEHGMLADLVIR